jgi:peroxiredoxin
MTSPPLWACQLNQMSVELVSIDEKHCINHLNKQTMNRQKAFSILLSALILPAFLMLTSCSKEDDVSPDNNPNMDDDSGGNGGSAPNFSLSSLGGGTVELSDFNNKVVVLFFFGNNCPSCKAVGPDVESKLNTAYAGRADYAIIGLDQWDGNSSSVQAFKNNTGVSFPLLLMASGVAKDYDTTYDRLVVIDKDGNIAHKGSSAATNDIGNVTSKVDALLDNM